MKKKSILVMSISFIMLLSLTAGFGGGAEWVAAEAAEPEYIFKLTHDGPSQGIQPDGQRYFKRRLEELSNGRIRVDLYHGASLADKVASLEGLQLGTIEVTEVSASDLSAYNSKWDVLGMPYFFESSIQAVETFRDPAVHSVFSANAEGNGFIIISWLDVGARDIFTMKRPINSVNDMKGVKIRVMPSPALIACMTDFGASPINIPFSDCYSAMQQGTIDAVENATAVLVSNGFPELGGYYSYTQHFIIPDQMLFSKTVYDSLPSDLQEAVMQAGTDLEKFWNYTLWPEAEKTSAMQLADYDVEIINPDLTGFFATAEKSRAILVENFNEEQKEAYNLIVSVKDKYK